MKLDKTYIEFMLSFPPSVNRYYSKTRNGVFISKHGRKFRDQSYDLIKEQLGSFETIKDRMKVGVILYPPDRRVRDLDNYMKGLLDAITHAEVWEDDHLIDQLEIYRGEIKKFGQTTVIIGPAENIIPIDKSDTVIDELFGE